MAADSSNCKLQASNKTIYQTLQLTFGNNGMILNPSVNKVGMIPVSGTVLAYTYIFNFYKYDPQALKI